MKKILLILVLTALAVSTAFSLEPIKVGFVYNGSGAVDVRVQLANNTNNALFVGETFTSITPNGSGIIILNVEDYIGSANAWTNYSAANVNNKTTLDIYVNGSFYVQYRLDALILNQAQTTVFNQTGNFIPQTDNSTLGTDGNRWKDAFVSESTLHIGPDDGLTNENELAIRYDASGIAHFIVDNEIVIESTDELITFNKLVSQNIGNDNTAFGTGVLRVNTTGTRNSGFGVSGLASNTTGNANTATGKDALNANTSGSQNTANGVKALFSNTTGNFNTANGFLALNTNTTGIGNTANGASALYSNTDGNYNTATGTNVLLLNTTGNFNIGSGYAALQSNTTGTYNTATGVAALYSNTTGSNNIANGNYSGSSITTGSDNIFIGSGAGEVSQVANVNNSIAIGANTFTTADNQVVIGDANITETQLNGLIQNDVTLAATRAAVTTAKTSVINYTAGENIINADLPTARAGTFLYLYCTLPVNVLGVATVGDEVVTLVNIDDINWKRVK